MALSEYARGECWVCDTLPPEILDEINETRRKMRCGPDAVMQWLVAEKGYDPADLKRGSLNYHFQRGHHEPR